MFKIIAIQTLPIPAGKYKVAEGVHNRGKYEHDLRLARHDSIMKVLHSEEWFWLVKGYSFIDGEVIRTEDELPMDFFSERGPYISISAIVGENGMGKSSLLELFFRIVNNASFALRLGLEVPGESLLFVRDIYARVWFQDDKAIRYIEQNDGLLRIYNQSDRKSEWDFDYDSPKSNESDSQKAKDCLRSLFYTIVVNYSQYAYNINDFLAEWEDLNEKGEAGGARCWLCNLFHRKDEYQMPIVLNPSRENGNYDINREKDLTQTRLFNLVLNGASPLKKILRKKEAKAFIFDIDYDFTPIPSKRYYSKKVVTQMSQMRLLSHRNDYKTVNFIGRRITAAWGHALGFEIESRQDNDYWKSMDDVRTINYIVYKTLKIAKTYERYSKFEDCFGDAKQVREYVWMLNKDTSHIMLKIRRCLAFLMFHHYGTGSFVNGKTEGNIMTVDDFNVAINHCLDVADAQYEDLKKARFTTPSEGKPEPHIWMPDELMPAPSFNTDILLVGEDGDPVRFSSLSSGEKQMIFSVSTVLYQLRNLESAWVSPTQTSVTYKNVCLVFDEIELCAHPKYQLMLIKLLLDSIKSLGLFHVQNVQIIVSTHSPFMLSDIPSSNILAIADGAPFTGNQPVNSFCANVYDLLNNQFFLNTSVGEFAREKLNELIKDINKYGEDPSSASLASLKQRVEVIGDSYVKYKLKKALE